MRVLHLNAGNETGGGMYHILSLLSQFKRGEVVLGVFEKGEMYRRALELNIETVVFEQKKQSDVRILSNLIHYIKLNEFTFIHTHGPRATLFMAMIKKFISQPLITTIHSNPCDDFLGRGIKGKVCFQLFKASFRAVDHFVVISTTFSKLMQRKFKVPKEKISTTLNGIKFDSHFEPYTKSKLNCLDEHFVIAMIARLEPVKQPILAVQTVEHVIKKFPHVRLIIIGEGTYKDKVQLYIKERSLEKYVHLLGYREDTEQILATVDLVLLTSKSESFPLVLLEAARAKVPIVTTNVGDVKKLIPNSDYGWVVENQDSYSLAQTIEDVIRLAQQGMDLQQVELLYDRAFTKFSLKHFHDSIRQIYIKVKFQ